MVVYRQLLTSTRQFSHDCLRQLAGVFRPLPSVATRLALHGGDQIARRVPLGRVEPVRADGVALDALGCDGLGGHPITIGGSEAKVGGFRACGPINHVSRQAS